MYIKGASRRSVGFWARHLQDIKENLRAEIVETRGLAADNLRDMMLEMQQDASLTRCKNFMYIASFNPCPHEHPTERQWEQMYEIFEKHRGIPAGQQRIVIEHEKEGRTHRHVVWNRIDLENMRAFPDGKNPNVCDAAEKEIERKLGLERTPSLLDRDPGTPREPRNPKSYEMYRGMKSGIDPRDVTAEVTAIFRESEHAADFVEGLRQRGYQFVKGNRAYCILDTAGNEHSLARRLDGVNTKELRAFMKGIDLSGIPTLEQAKAQYQERKLAHLQADHATVKHEIEWEEGLAKAAIEKERTAKPFLAPEDREKETPAGGRKKESRAQQQPETGSTSPIDRFKDAGLEVGGAAGPEKPLRGMEKKLCGTYRSCPNATDFVAALDDYGIAFARVTADEAHESHREAQFAKAVERMALVYQEGEIVVVRSPGPEYLRQGEWTESNRVNKLDQAHAEHYLKVLSLDKSKLKGIDATKTMLDASAQDRADYWQAIRLERATTIRDRTATRSIRDDLRIIGAASSLGVGAVGKGLDIVSSLFESVFAQKLTPEQKYQGEKARLERESQADHTNEVSRYLADRRQRERDHTDRDR